MKTINIKKNKKKVGGKNREPQLLKIYINKVSSKYVETIRNIKM